MNARAYYNFLYEILRDQWNEFDDIEFLDEYNKSTIIYNIIENGDLDAQIADLVCDYVNNMEIRHLIKD